MDHSAHAEFDGIAFRRGRHHDDRRAVRCGSGWDSLDQVESTAKNSYDRYFALLNVYVDHYEVRLWVMTAKHVHILECLPKFGFGERSDPAV